jgi:hypothetical protein
MTCFPKVREIEDRWQARFGEERIRSIRECIGSLFVARGAERLLLAEGLVPAEGTGIAHVAAQP